MWINIKEPKSYNGIVNAKVLGNFFLDVEKYAKQMNGSLDETKVKVTAIFLIDTMKL
jgi:hypothetical protein